MFKEFAHGAELKTIRDLLEKDLDKEVDYKSDTVFVEPNRSLLPPSAVKTTIVVLLVRSVKRRVAYTITA